MHDPESERSDSQDNGGNNKMLPWTEILDPHKKHATEDEPQHANIRQKIAKETRDWFKKLWKAGPAKQVELILAGAIALFALIQLCTTIKNNESTTQQADQLIAAAKIGAYASDQNAQASRNFADSARSINDGIANAVGRLNLQASATASLAQAAEAQSRQAQAQTDRMTESLTKTDRLIEESSRQARATNDLATSSARSANAADIANSQTVGLFERQNRPWVGIDGEFLLTGNEIQDSGSLLHVRYVLKNYGISPASNVITQLAEIPDSSDSFDRTKAEIDKACKLAEGLLSWDTGDIILPTATISQPSSFSQKLPYTGKILIPGCIVYRDTSNVVHHTRVCNWIDLNDKSPRNGFASCWHESAD